MSAQFAVALDALEPGTATLAVLTNAAGKRLEVAVVRAEDGDVYAIDDLCTHADVSLSEGEVTGCFVECWAHGSRFDLRTGEPDELPAVMPVKTYAVTIEGGNVLVDVDAPKVSTKENA